MSKIEDMMKELGYSSKAIEYYIKKVNVEEIEDPDAFFAYTGPCGDTMEIYLKIKSDVIKDAKFQAIGCAGAFSSGSALCEMIKGKTLQEAKQIDEEDIIKYLGKIPPSKVDCVCLANKTFRKR